MKFNEISSLNDLANERARLYKELRKQEARVNESYDYALMQTKEMISPSYLIRALANHITSIETVKKHPGTYFKLGVLVAKKLMGIFRKK